MSSTGEQPPTDEEGFLLDFHLWTETFALDTASGLGLTLNDRHWTVIHSLRTFYETCEESPNMRLLVRWLRQDVGQDLGNSIALAQLFNGNPALEACKLAGLPRPANCY